MTRRRITSGFVYGRADAERAASHVADCLEYVNAAEGDTERSRRACDFRSEATRSMKIIRQVDPSLMPTGAERMERSFGWGKA